MSGSEKSRKLQASLSYHERVRLGDAAVERKGREGREEILFFFASFAASALIVTFARDRSQCRLLSFFEKLER